MNSITELKEVIEHFYDIETEEGKDALLDSIKAYSESVHPEYFIRELRENFKQHSSSGIGVIYEAIGHNPAKWGQLFFEEIQRAFIAAENSINPFEILDSLEEIGMTEVSQIETQFEIIKLLSSYLTHENDIVRYKADWILGDWIYEGNVDQSSQAIAGLQERLKDDHWKIRYITHEVLKDIKKLPRAYSQSFADRMQVMISSPYKLD